MNHHRNDPCVYSTPSCLSPASSPAPWLTELLQGDGGELKLPPCTFLPLPCSLPYSLVDWACTGTEELLGSHSWMMKEDSDSEARVLYSVDDWLYTEKCSTHSVRSLCDFIFNYVYTCVCVGTGVYTRVHACGCQRRVSNPLEPKLHTAVSYPTWVLGAVEHTFIRPDR